MKFYAKVLKFNPNHDKFGLFASTEGGGGGGGAEKPWHNKLKFKRWALQASPQERQGVLEEIQKERSQDIRPYPVKPRYEDHPAGWRKFEDWQRRSLNRSKAEQLLKKNRG